MAKLGVFKFTHREHYEALVKMIDEMSNITNEDDLIADMLLLMQIIDKNDSPYHRVYESISGIINAIIKYKASGNKVDLMPMVEYLEKQGFCVCGFEVVEHEGD